LITYEATRRVSTLSMLEVVWDLVAADFLQHRHLRLAILPIPTGGMAGQVKLEGSYVAGDGM
jgi:hypothetical protein